ncbi:MAG: hypothetical protein VX640_16145 [Pseudomonadota bacterium]|nr:hypothetical protein [Pseudomonadota bacterium]
MVRITMILLCLLLAGAAAGRYQAEVSVRETRREIQELDRTKADELSQIQLLRAEIAYLENPDRLAKIAAKVTDLEPLSGGQMMTADQFVVAFGDGAAESGQLAGGDVILHALAMADMKTVE